MAAVVVDLGRLVEVEKEIAKLVEAFRAELLRPAGFHLADRLANDADGGLATCGERDAFGAQVLGVWLACEVVEALELAEQVVDGLFGHAQAGSQFGGPRALRPG